MKELKRPQWLRPLAALTEDLDCPQSPHDGSQPSVIPVLGDLTPSSGLQGHEVYTWYTGIKCIKITIHIKFRTQTN